MIITRKIKNQYKSNLMDWWREEINFYTILNLNNFQSSFEIKVIIIHNDDNTKIECWIIVIKGKTQSSNNNIN